MTTSPTAAQATEASQVLLAPGQDQPVLDPHVQSFLDRRAEAAALQGSEQPPRRAPVRSRHHFQPATPERAGAAMLYLHVPGHTADTPDEAVQFIADSAGALLVLQSLPLHARIEDLDLAIVAALNELGDASAVLLGGHGIGALIALCFASRPASAPFSFEMLVLATPVLGWPDASGSTSWLSIAAAHDHAALARDMLDDAGWPIDYSEDRLRRLPPLLILTADVDPFRQGAEDFARRLLAGERDVTAVRTIGSIHDFSWLPDLLDARCTKTAHALIVDSLRPRPRDVIVEGREC